MPVTVELPGVLPAHVAGRTAIEVEVQVGTTVRALLRRCA